MKEKQQCVSIGGQALIEGVMMQSRTTQAMAVRNPDGFVEVKVKKLKIISDVRPLKYIKDSPINRKGPNGITLSFCLITLLISPIIS